MVFGIDEFFNESLVSIINCKLVNTFYSKHQKKYTFHISMISLVQNKTLHTIKTVVLHQKKTHSQYHFTELTQKKHHILTHFTPKKKTIVLHFTKPIVLPSFLFP